MNHLYVLNLSFWTFQIAILIYVLNSLSSAVPLQSFWKMQKKCPSRSTCPRLQQMFLTLNPAYQELPVIRCSAGKPRGCFRSKSGEYHGI